MTLFEYCLLAHLVGDYLVQTEFEAMNKALGKFWNRGLVAHCLKYTACFVLPFLSFGVNLWWLLPVYATHMVFDRRWPIVLWRKYVNHNTDESIAKTFWLTIMTDQIFHILVIAIIAGCAL